MPAKKKTPVTKRSTTRRPARSVPTAESSLNFTALVDAIRQVHEQSTALVNRTVNTTLTLRNWVIGAYIHHYELHGKDRAKYGEGLLDALAERLASKGIKRIDERELRRFRPFYQTYPGIRETLSPELGAPLPVLISRLSFSHVAELITIEDPLKRVFYEIEAIRGNWSVRALKRQIATLYFERSGLSKDKKKLEAMVKKGVETAEPKLAIRDPYIFEFLGLRAQDAVAESDLLGI